MAVDPPKSAAQRWEVSFGSMTPCIFDDSSEVIIQQVRIEPESAESKAVVFSRHVTPDAVAATPVRERLDFLPFVSTYGGPPDFDQPYVTGRYAGIYREGVDGLRVRQSCASVDTTLQAVNARQVPREGFAELVVNLEVDGATGVAVDQLFVDYEADGKDYTLDVDFTMIACGTTDTRQLCR